MVEASYYLWRSIIRIFQSIVDPAHLSPVSSHSPPSNIGGSRCSAAWRDALRVRRSDERPVLIPSDPSPSVEPSGSSLRLTEQIRSGWSAQKLEGWMQGLLITLATVGIVAGLSAVSAAELLEAQGSSPQNLFTAASPTQSAGANAIVRTVPPPNHNEHPDCEDTGPSNGHSATILNRFVRSSPSSSDVQCPIPTADRPFTEEELHP